MKNVKKKDKENVWIFLDFPGIPSTWCDQFSWKKLPQADT